ncbi:hypothetical protein RHGRI_020196 [Rhododendron griersonianum]|uniref:FAR1 domain-containing protein n=1 Tax=Rhododendron griersonianum TaxID=479676 RepID=A0AAV6JFH8_9ERIC|nr:hypothetical protein RHGRI_020196 [Rhododendron griersonianum]
MLFVCAKEGKYVAKPKNDGVMEGDEKREEDEEVKTKKRFRNRSTVRCDCKAHLQIKYDKWSSKWKVTVFNDTHNHQLVTPSKRMKMRLEAMNDLSEKLLKISSYVPPPINVCHEIDDLHSTERTQVLLLDPNISQTKGRKKDVKGKDATIHSGRLKSGIEFALNKKKRKCNLCKGIGHDKSNLS